jgi:hypothetical protein
LTLRDLEGTGNPFWKITAKEMVEGERAMALRFGRRLGTVRTASGVLWLWGAALQLRLSLLKVLLGSIASDIDESSSSGGYLHALGFGA